MNPEERAFDKEMSVSIRNKIPGLIDDMAIIKDSQKEIHIALLGSIITGDGGLVKRMIEQEMRMEKQEAEIQEIKKILSNEKVLTTVMYAIGGAVLFAAMTYGITQLFKAK